MNRKISNTHEVMEIKSFFNHNKKIKEIFVIVLIALVLLFAISKVFYDTNEGTSETFYNGTETEKKVTQILSEIEGVGEVEVMIYETEEKVSGVVIVCDGAKNIRVVMDIQEAVSVALGTTKENIKIYLKR